MGERSSYPEGVPAWVDLMTSDPAAAREFYAPLFGWEYEIDPSPESGNYTQALVDGKRVAGLGGQPVPGAPTVWTTYVAADDADKVVERVREHGGTVQIEPMSVLDAGRMAVVADPAGAVFGIWQAGTHAGAQLVNVPGALVWTELHVPAAAIDAVTDFYGKVFGYEWEELDMGGGVQYRMVRLGGRAIAGVMPETAGSTDAPPFWLVYFDVADVDAAVASATGRGATLLAPATDTPAGRMATLRDPQGGVFSLITAVNADD